MGVNRDLVGGYGEKDVAVIMGVRFTTLTKKDLMQDYLIPLVRSGKKGFVVTANPEIVMNTRENPVFNGIVQYADVVVPDGAGIVFAAKWMKLPMTERIAGFDLMVDLLKFANDQQLSCYFLGARQHVIEKFIKKIKTDYPHIQVAGYHHGFFQDDTFIVKQIKEAKPNFVFVAMGSPRQEEWIARHYKKFSKGLFMGVGGSFDVIAGEVKRAPDSWIRLNLEWLYRLLKQPFRLKRFWKSVRFVLLVLRGRA